MRDYRVWVRDMEGETQGLLKSFLGKTPGMLARVALVLGMLDWAEGGDPEPPTVLGMEVFDRAHVLVAEYLWPMARRSYAEAAASSEERAARTLARWLQRERPSQFGKSVLLSRALEGLRNVGDVEAALKQLVDARILQEIKISTKGRPRFEYVVNPRIWD